MVLSGCLWSSCRISRGNAECVAGSNASDTPRALNALKQQCVPASMSSHVPPTAPYASTSVRQYVSTSAPTLARPVCQTRHVRRIFARQLKSSRNAERVPSVTTALWPIDMMHACRMCSMCDSFALALAPTGRPGRRLSPASCPAASGERAPPRPRCRPPRASPSCSSSRARVTASGRAKEKLRRCTRRARRR